MTDRSELLVMAKDEQAEFVELATGLTEEEWSAPSLCAGLSVRDVVVHTAAHIHKEPSIAEIAVTVVRSGFRVSRTENSFSTVIWTRPQAHSAFRLIPPIVTQTGLHTA